MTLLLDADQTLQLLHSSETVESTFRGDQSSFSEENIGILVFRFVIFTEAFKCL